MFEKKPLGAVFETVCTLTCSNLLVFLFHVASVASVPVQLCAQVSVVQALSSGTGGEGFPVICARTLWHGQAQCRGRG